MKMKKVVLNAEPREGLAACYDEDEGKFAQLVYYSDRGYFIFANNRFNLLTENDESISDMRLLEIERKHYKTVRDIFANSVTSGTAVTYVDLEKYVYTYEVKEAITAAVFSQSEFSEAEEEKVIADLTDEEIEVLRQEAKTRKDQENDGISRDEDGRIKYTPETQPRDASGKFRQVLARIKQNLGNSGLQNVLEKIKEAENFDSTGNYAGAAKAAADLLGIIDRLDSGALNSDALENVRTSAAELGKVIANLPFAFGEDAEKIRFSDIPPALRDLMKDMITRVEDKIGEEDADIATADLRNFMSGGDYYNQSEVSSQMAKLLRLLT